MFQIWLKQDMEKKNILSDTNVAGGCVACKGKKCYFAMMLYKKVPDFIEIGGGVGAGPGPSAPVVNISDDVTPIKQHIRYPKPPEVKVKIWPKADGNGGPGGPV